MSKTELLLTLADNMRTLADSLQALAESESKDKGNEPTLEEVRAALSEKSRTGRTTEVKELLQKYGAGKLSEVDPTNYAALLKDAEVIDYAT